MTQEEKLEEAKSLYKTANADQKYVLESLFPELAESKDERIRKELLAVIDDLILPDEQKERFVAWLEKQGKNNMGISEATKQKLEDNLNKALEKETPKSCNEFLEKQGEQKTIDEIAKEVCKNKELAVVFLKSAGIINEKGELAEQYRQDEQKPTDKVEPKFKVGQTIKKEGFNLGFTIVKIEHGFYYNDVGDNFPFTDQDNWELVEQNSAWSEEDEKNYDISLKIMCASNKSEELINKLYDWFKSLKNRVQLQTTWKPSKEQMEGIECTIKTLRYQLNAGDNRLDSLYNDLKKLREK